MYTHASCTCKYFTDSGAFQPYENNFFSRQPIFIDEFDTTTGMSTITQPSITSTTSVFINKTVPNGYLVWSPGCEMPALNPLAKDVMHIFHREKYETCSKTAPLTSIQMNWTTSTATLLVNKNVVWYKAAKDVSCCYQEIRRSGTGKNADEQFK